MTSSSRQNSTGQKLAVIRRLASYNQTAAVSTICYVVVPPKALSEVDENRLDELAKTMK